MEPQHQKEDGESLDPKSTPIGLDYGAELKALIKKKTISAIHRRRKATLLLVVAFGIFTTIIGYIFPSNPNHKKTDSVTRGDMVTYEWKTISSAVVCIAIFELASSELALMRHRGRMKSFFRVFSGEGSK